MNWNNKIKNINFKEIKENTKKCNYRHSINIFYALKCSELFKSLCQVKALNFPSGWRCKKK